MIKTYSELVSQPTLEQRFEYCMLKGTVCEDTFGFLRYLNQSLYMGKKWRLFRDKLIVRDDGCELAVPDLRIRGRVILHHLNPLTPEQIENLDDCIFDPENLVCVSHEMHNAIHYGDFSLVKPVEIVERSPFDTAPWRTIQ